MDWKRKLIWSIFTVTLLIPLISTTIKVNIIPQTHASPDNTISIMPSNITDLGLAVDDTFAVNITVDYVELLWQWQFELTYNPDVIQGEWFDETEGYPVEADPYGFLESEGGTVVVPSDQTGWNNTQGKLYGTTASLLLKLHPVNGSGVLARATFRVVGKGESNITLTDYTALYTTIDGIIPTGLGHGYFRNVGLTELPTASFTHSPVGTPEPLQGYYTEFDGSGSTATGAKTIDKYKWYFWTDYSQRSFLAFDQIKLRPDGDGTYTDWTNNWEYWNETKGDTYVIANADTMYESSTLQNHTTQIYNIGKVRVTVIARNSITASDEKVRIMLVIGGTRYYGDIFNVTSVWSKYTSDWATNPATGSAWAWSDIDSLEAGVESVQNGASWTGEIRISELYVEPTQPPIVEVDFDTIYQNITSRGPWKVSLTVTDSGGIVGTTTNDVTIKGHDVAIVLIKTDATDMPRTIWPKGMPYVEIDEIVPVNVTVENRGDFSEQHSPSSNFTVTVFYTATLGLGEGIEEEIIGKANITTPIAAKANTTLTFQWDTSGRNITHPRPHMLYANVTRVQYEYKVGDNLVTEGGTGHRVRFHDVAVTEVEVYPHRILRPDGDGTFTDWTGTYEDWDDWPEHNGDTDYISVTADALNASSTLESHLLETWSIDRVRVTIVARNTDSASNEEVKIMLALGGVAYLSTGEELTTSYSEYSNDWETNPATGSEWTWQYVDLLEVGVVSVAVAGWTGEIRVTQIYVEVFGTAGPVSRGELAEVAVTVKNQGDFSETDIDVTAYYDGGSIGTQTIYLLTNSSYGIPPNFATANHTITLRFDWNTTGISVEDYTVSADITLVPDEYDPYDNTYVNGIMGVIAGPEPSTLSLLASPDNMTIGETTTLSGALTPALEGETINIQCRLGGAAWSDVASVLTDGSGQYSYEWTQTETAGNFQFKASWSGNADYLPAESIVITVVVRKLSSTITITVDKTEIRYGDNLNFAGKITPVRASVSVTLWYKAGVADWEDLLSSFTTDENGEYTRTFGPNRAVTWQFKASWDGDAITEGAESDVVTVEVLPGERVDWTLPAVAVVAVIIVVVVAVYFLKFRKKS